MVREFSDWEENDICEYIEISYTKVIGLSCQLMRTCSWNNVEFYNDLIKLQSSRREKIILQGNGGAS